MQIQERSEADILARAPIKVQFGGKEYDVQVLTILKARKWREQLADVAKDIAGKLSGDTNGIDGAFFSGLAAGFLQFPEKIADLIFSYAPDLPRQEIEESATEEELALAFSQIMKVAFPFVRQLALVNTVLSTAQSLSPSAKFTN
jgi:hypothetical protein